MKNQIIVFVAGALIVILGAYLKINTKYDFTDIIISVGLFIELIAITWIIKILVNRKNKRLAD